MLFHRWKLNAVINGGINLELNEMINFVKENNKIIVTLSLTIFTSVIFPELKVGIQKSLILKTNIEYSIGQLL